MNKEQIIQMAQDAGAQDFSFVEKLLEEYEKARIAIIAATKEEDAKICESMEITKTVLGVHPDYIKGKEMAFSQAARAILESKP